MEKEILNGLTYHEVKLRLKKYGKNSIETESSYSALKIFISQFPTFINTILFIAGLFSVFIGHYVDSGFIFAIILLNGILGFIQEYRAQQSIEKLKDFTAPVARVIREGRESEVLAENLVPGDVVILSEGSRVPADGTLKTANHLEVDESILTGESLAVMKKVDDEVFLGTLAQEGKGRLIVEKTGMETRFGQIANTLSAIPEEKAPLQKNLDSLGKMLSIFALGVGLLTVPIGLLYGGSLVPLVLVGATIGLAAIPEGLPAVVTIAFAIGAHRMATRGAIVRKMAAIETLGAVQFILSDKTGTITQNMMRAKKHWLMDEAKLHLLKRACILGNTASLVEKASGKEYEVIGDQTDGALLAWVKQNSNNGNDEQEGEVLDEYVFDPEYKTITTVWKDDKSKDRQVFVRGAPESILSKSVLSEEKRNMVRKKFEDFAKEGLRIIAFATKIEKHNGKLTREHLEQELTFLGVVGIYDPPREEVVDAIRKSKRAGIHVIMVTGDNEKTALSLAREIGLIEEDEDVVTGDELSKMSDEELEKIMLKARIFARTQPEEKLRLASALKNQGIVVGVTGDGVNDTLALKKADVGVAMGKGGTDVAKESSDIILTKNSFANLIMAIEEGRIIYKNITNAVIYLISGNLAEISLVFFATLFHLPFILLPTQILWINLVTDSLPALALATGSRDATVINHKPRDPKMPILNGRRLVIICLIGFSLSGFLIALFVFLLGQNASEAVARGAVFNLLIYFHLLIVMGIGRHSLQRGNMFLVFTVVLIFMLQIIISTIPFFQEVFRLV